MRRLHVLAVGIATACVAAGVALATAPSGTRTVDYSAQGTFAGNLVAAGDGVALAAQRPPTDVVAQAITYAPGASSGWHSHVGIVVVVVKDGAVTRYGSNCLGQTFHQGDVFIESSMLGSIVLRNEGGAPAHLAATFISPHPANLRVDQPNPGCGVS
jgi:quercetin dioxygenase-like cupin family protein